MAQYGTILVVAGYYSSAGQASCLSCSAAAAATPYSPPGSAFSGCTSTCPNGYACQSTTQKMTICPAGESYMSKYIL